MGRNSRATSSPGLPGVALRAASDLRRFTPRELLAALQALPGVVVGGRDPRATLTTLLSQLVAQGRLTRARKGVYACLGLSRAEQLAIEMNRRCSICGEWALLDEMVRPGLHSGTCRACKAERRVRNPARDDGEKRCPDCGETKPRTAFHRSSWNSDGRTSWCKPCCTVRTRITRAKSDAPARPLTVKQRQARRRANRRWAQRNPDKVRESRERHRARLRALRAEVRAMEQGREEAA